MPTYRYKNADGATLPSVTGVIGILGENKRALVHSAWKLGMEGKDYREVWGKAANAGTAAHALAEAHMVHGPPSPEQVAEIVGKLTPEESAGALARYASFRDWLNQNTYQPVASEVPLINERLQFGGTIDAVGLLNGRPALIDLKSKTLYKDQIIQVAAYKFLWDEAHPDQKIESVHILGMSDGFHHHQIIEDSLGPATVAFFSLLVVHGSLKGIKC